jgi:hypothetical protein
MEIYADDYVDRAARWLIENHPYLVRRVVMWGNEHPYPPRVVCNIITRFYPEPVEYKQDLACQVIDWLFYQKVDDQKACIKKSLLVHKDIDMKLYSYW